MNAVGSRMFGRGGRMRLLHVMMVLLVAILAACSGTSQPVDNKDAVGKEGEKGQQEGQPKPGGVYTILSPADPDMLDPHKQSSIYTHNIVGLVYSKLLTYKTGPDVDYSDYVLTGDLAEDWEVSEDGKVYTFHLRKDAKWQNVPPVNGRPVVAEDVIATMERIRSLPGHQAYMLEKVEKMEAPDDHTVVFTLKEPFAPFLNYMANHYMWILPKEGVEGKFDLATKAIGSGPFILEKWEDNVEAILKRNPDYYEKGKPYLDEVRIMVVPDQGARIAAFRAGQAESIGIISPREVENLRKSNPDINVSKVLFPTYVIVYMNMTKPPFDDLRVRKAISMAIDRKGLTKQIFGDGEVSSPVNPSLADWGLPLEEREALQPYDPEKAKALLKEAGYPNGFSTKIMVTNAYGEQVIQAAQWIAEDLKKVGINAEIEVVEYATYFSKRWPGLQYDIGVGFQSFYQEPDEWLRGQLHSKSPRNWFGVKIPELDKMLDEQRLIMDEEQRKKKVHEIQRYVLENVINPIPLITHYVETPHQPWVRDHHPHASYGNTHLKDVWLDK